MVHMFYSVILVVGFGTHITYAVQCSDGWIRHENVCYLISDELETFTGAEEMCKLMRGTLAEIRSSSENHFIATRVQSTKDRFWIGATDIQVEGEFRWISTGELIEFSSWASGQPDDASHLEDCVEFVGGASVWNDYQCRNTRRYICEQRDTTSEIIGK